MHGRCASSSYKTEIRSNLHHANGRISGEWGERSFNAADRPSRPKAISFHLDERWRPLGREHRPLANVSCGRALTAASSSVVRETTHAAMAAVVMLSGQAALAFHKYLFTNGLVLGTTLAAVTWCQDAARHKRLPRSRVALILLATSTAALKLILHHVAHVFALRKGPLWHKLTSPT